jgi:hypothetical protein
MLIVRTHACPNQHWVKATDINTKRIGGTFQHANASPPYQIGA